MMYYGLCCKLVHVTGFNRIFWARVHHSCNPGKINVNFVVNFQRFPVENFRFNRGWVSILYIYTVGKKIVFQEQEHRRVQWNNEVVYPPRLAHFFFLRPFPYLSSFSTPAHFCLFISVNQSWIFLRVAWILKVLLGPLNSCNRLPSFSRDPYPPRVRGKMCQMEISP